MPTLTVRVYVIEFYAAALPQTMPMDIREVSRHAGFDAASERWYSARYAQALRRARRASQACEW